MGFTIVFSLVLPARVYKISRDNSQKKGYRTRPRQLGTFVRTFALLQELVGKGIHKMYVLRKKKKCLVFWIKSRPKVAERLVARLAAMLEAARKLPAYSGPKWQATLLLGPKQRICIETTLPLAIDCGMVVQRQEAPDVARVPDYMVSE